MSSTLIDAFRHNAWANRRLIEFCRGLSSEQLAASTTGSFGNILEVWAYAGETERDAMRQSAT